MQEKRDPEEAEEAPLEEDLPISITRRSADYAISTIAHSPAITFRQASRTSFRD